VELDSEIDRLYGVPLDEFVRDRDELAKRLRREGEREAADRIKALRKPSAGAWALNQAVRRRRKETDALLAAGERLRAAHESLLSGGDPAELREAMQEERDLASGLADCAEAIASETGKSGPALRERVRSTLHAATVDEEAREELTRGRFVREREAAGLGPFGAGETGAAPPRSRAKRARGTPKEGRAGAGGTRGGTATGDRAGRQGRAAAGDGARGAGASTRGRSGAAEKERSAAAREEAAARERRERLAEAERSVEEARAALEEAEASHREAAAELQTAREAVGAAEDAEREARAVARERRREAGKLERELERLRPKGR
jgi:hypothetical protein